MLLTQLPSKRAFEEIENKWAAPDLIVANAGVAYWIKTTEMELKKARQNSRCESHGA